MKLLTVGFGSRTLPKTCFYILLSTFLIGALLPLSWGSEETGKDS